MNNTNYQTQKSGSGSTVEVKTINEKKAKVQEPGLQNFFRRELKFKQETINK